MRRTCMAVAAALLPSAILLGACGGNDPPAVPDGNPGGQIYQLQWGPVTVEPFQEDTRCITVPLGNDIPVKIHEIHNVLGTASHHFIVYRVSDGEVNETPTPCTPFVDTLDPTAGSPLMVTQKADETLVLPEGVAFTLQPDQLVRLEMHFVNPTSEPQTVSATSTLYAMADADFVHEADFLFIGNPDISLRSQPSVQSLGPTWFPIPGSLDGVEIFAITGHTHKLGTDVQVAVSDSEDGADTMVYEPIGFSWSEPETTRHDPPINLPPDGGFRFTCEWVNETGREVGFGEAAEDEMCFFWAYYYPSQGSKVCVHTEMYTDSPLDICCPDDAVLCALISEYLGELGP